MIDFLLSLSTWAGCVVTMGFTAVVSFVVYLVFYKLISKYQREDIQDPTSILFRVVHSQTGSKYKPTPGSDTGISDDEFATVRLLMENRGEAYLTVA